MIFWFLWLAIVSIFSATSAEGSESLHEDEAPFRGDKFDVCSVGRALGNGWASVVPGGGYDPTTGRYAWICLMYPWELETGYGRETLGGGEIVRDATTAISATPVVERIACTGNGAGTHPSLGSVTEEACYHAGHAVYRPIMPRFAIGLDKLRPGGSAYLSVPEGETGAIFVNSGCGRTSVTTYRDTAIDCPILPPPNDTFQVRGISIVEDRKVYIEGQDADGPLQPFDGTDAEKIVGVYLGADSGHFQGCVTGDCADDKDGTGVSISVNGIFDLGALPAPNRCHPVVDDGAVKCNITPNNNTIRLVAEAVSGREYDLLQDTSVSFPDVCISNQVSVSGTCVDDPRIQATSNGDCDFTASGGPDLGPAESFSALAQRLSAQEEEVSLVRMISENVNFDHTDADGGDTVVLKPGPNQPWAPCGGGTGSRMFVGAKSNSKVQTLPGRFQRLVAAGTPENLRFTVARPSIALSSRSEIVGGTWINVTYPGRIADDDQEPGTQTATSGSDTTLVNTAASWTVNEWEGMSAVIRPDAGFPGEGYDYGGDCDCDTELCSVAATIASNTSDTLTLTAIFGASAWTSNVSGASCAQNQNPQNGDEYRITAASCSQYPTTGVGDEACDLGVAMKPGALQKGTFRDFVFWRGGNIDGGSNTGLIHIKDASWVLHNYVVADSGPFIWEDLEFNGLSVRGGNIGINAGFQGETKMRNIVFRNCFGTMVNVGTGKGLFAEDITFENCNGIGFNIPRGPAWIKRAYFNGHSGSGINISPLTADAVWGVVVQDVLARNVRGNTVGSNFIEISGVAGSGEIRSLTFDNITAYMDPSTSAGTIPGLFHFDSSAAFAGQYGNVTIKNSSIETLTKDGAVVACAVADPLAAGNCDTKGSPITSLASPPVMINNRENGFPVPDQPYNWDSAASYKSNDGQAQLDCDDLTNGWAKVAINDDTSTGACADAGPDGLLDGGGTAKSLCICSEGTWHSAY